MATNSEHIPTGPGYKSLITSIALMVLIPTLGLWGCTYLQASYPDGFFKNAWESKYDICGRLWLFASFASTTLVTVTIMLEIIRDDRFNTIRAQRQFNNSVLIIIVIAIFLPILGFAGLMTPPPYALWMMKLL